MSGVTGYERQMYADLTRARRALAVLANHEDGLLVQVGRVASALERLERRLDRMEGLVAPAQSEAAPPDPAHSAYHQSEGGAS